MLAAAKLPDPPHHGIVSQDAVLALHGPGTIPARFDFPHGLHFEGLTIANYSHDTQNSSFQSTNLFQDGTRPPNYQLLADELATRFAFQRDRQSIAAYVRQHNSTIHPWWPAADPHTLLLTLADHSRKLLAASFVPSDPTWLHSLHFRFLMLQHGLPLACYTDGLALFGQVSTGEGRDPRSEFHSALTALGVPHLLAPSPQARGKIERRFGTLQNRLVTFLAFETITPPRPPKSCWNTNWPGKTAPPSAPPGARRTTPATRPRLNNAASCARARTPACWISTGRCTSVAGSMPPPKTTSSHAVG